MKKILILTLASILLLSYSAVWNFGLAENNKINIDLNNDGNIDGIVTSAAGIEIYRSDANKNLTLAHKFEYKTTKVSMFNQYNSRDAYLEIIFNRDISKVLHHKYEVGSIKYSVIDDSFSKEKFIITDINRDGLYDFIKIKEPTLDNPNFYEQQIYYQGKNCSFPNKPDKIIETQRSSFITGFYYDINNDGLLDKIEIRYKHYGSFLANTKCIIYIYLLRDKRNKYNEVPDMRLLSSGIFYEDINFRDINNDGYPDIVITDIPKKPKSIQDAISKLVERRTDISLKFYLYNKRAKGYPLAPTFVRKMNIDILQNLNIYIDNDFNEDGYNDLLITQLNHSEKYLFDPHKLNFSETQFR